MTHQEALDELNRLAPIIAKLEEEDKVEKIALFVETYDHGNDPHCCTNSLEWCAEAIRKEFGPSN